MPAGDEQPPRIARQRDEPLVVTLTQALTQQSIAAVEDHIRAVARSRLVIVDVTAVRSFDSDGTSDLLTLQEEIGPAHLLVVGMREAAARLVGSADVHVADARATDTAAAAHLLRRLPGLVMVTPDASSSGPVLEGAIAAAIAEDTAIVVVDLASFPVLTADLLDVVAYASSQAAIAGQELVLLNVAEPAAVSLREAGLAATTYLAGTP